MTAIADLQDYMREMTAIHGFTNDPAIDVGDPVILAAATDRSPAALGTIIARDPYPDRDVIVGVLHQDGVLRWRRRDALRVIGDRMATADLAADLRSMGLEDLADRVTHHVPNQPRGDDS